MPVLRTLLAVLSLVLLFATQSRAVTATYYDTYAAWGDRNEARHGHLYLYTGANASTDYFLYATGTAGATINNLVASQTGIGPYQPTDAYPTNADSNPGFGNNYFKLRSTNPMTWEVDETTDCHCGDAHGMVAAADNLNNYVGSIFMTYMRKDADPVALIGPPGISASQFGDQLAVISSSPTPISATVRKWDGTTWAAVATGSSPIIPAFGVWMWSPSQSSPPLTGGTLAIDSGHYRVDIAGGQGLLYKGNVYSPMPFSDPGGSRGYAWNRDNALLVCPDIYTGKKIGLNLVGAVVADHGSGPQVIVSNPSATAADFTLQRFSATSPGAVDAEWPINGNDPSGTWTNVQLVSGLASGARWSYTSPNDGFFRVVSSNGVSLTAIMGTALTKSRYTGGDYIFAKDTLQAIGKSFEWWGNLQVTGTDTTGDGPLEIHVISPFSGAEVTVSVDGATSGANYFTQTQTTTGVDQGLKFNVHSAFVQNVKFKVTSTQYAYVWAASNTGLSSDGASGRYGETFYSNPPMPQNLMVAQKSAAPATVTLNDTVTYVLTAKNIGAGATNAVMLWDTLPNGVTMQSSNPAPIYAVPPLYGWDMGTVPALSALSVTFTVSIDSAINGEIKHNYAQVNSLGAPEDKSPDAPVRVLIPGADLQKSANVPTANPGDTITYTINYFNSAAALPSTPRLNLRAKGQTYDANSVTIHFEVSNHSGLPISTSALTICYWIYDTPTTTGGQITPNCYGGGNTSPWAGWSGGTWTPTLTALAPSITRPDSRNANLQACWSYITAPNILPSGTVLSDINLNLSANWPAAWTPANNASISYSRRPNEAAYNDDSHYALYYQGNLVAEYTNSSTPDPNTGAEPRDWVQIYDTCPAEINYVSSSPAATSSGAAPLLSWFSANIPPQASAAFTWWGTVKAGTAGGTIITNRAEAQANTITALSNLATVVVPIVGTQTSTRTPTPSFSASPTPSSTSTPTLPGTFTSTSTATPSSTPSPTLSATPTFSMTYTPPPTNTPLPTATETPAPLLLSPLPPSPHPAGNLGVHIAYRLSTPATVSIRVFDVAGELVRDSNPVSQGIGPNEQFWDVKNTPGTPVASGLYIAKVTARSPAGEEQVIFIKVAVAR